jgi:hypothetical protein
VDLLELLGQVLIVGNEPIMEDSDPIFFIKVRVCKDVFNLLTRTIPRMKNSKVALNLPACLKGLIHFVETVLLKRN